MEMPDAGLCFTGEIERFCCWLFSRQYFFFWGLDIFLASKMTDALFRFQWQRFRFLAPGQEPSELQFRSSSGTLAA